MMGTSLMTLAELGELRLIEEVILPLAQEYDSSTHAGDDCAYLATSTGMLAITADVGPKPLLQSLEGFENDYDAAGWLAVVATASDVATAGATPFFLTNCIDAPAAFLVEDLRSFLRGYFSACAEFGFKNGGGDVRHGPTLAMRVFGAGKCEHPYKIGRSGARAGDRLVAIGPTGQFMATYLLAKNNHPSVISDGQLTSHALEVLRRPKPQLEALRLLAPFGLFSASSDTSDGLLGAVDNIARSSDCGFELTLSEKLLTPSIIDAAAIEGIDPWNIFVAWGDWSVIATIPKNHFGDFCDLCKDNSIDWLPLGHATPAHRSILATKDGQDLKPLSIIRNENFISKGFNAGLQGHLDYILKTPLQP